ncbi:hypothetical protein F5Y02DRAFT_403349 [Annulohypoxylon stygium]|nr:hypothetical protein F5Y02DRAFT_403349 [Annulohypoxylon stygium]
MSDISQSQSLDNQFHLVLELGDSIPLRFKTVGRVDHLVQQIQDNNIHLDTCERVLSITLEATTTTVHFGQGYSEIGFRTEAEARNLYHKFGGIFSYDDGYPTMLRFNMSRSQEEPKINPIQPSKKESFQAILKSRLDRLYTHIRMGKVIGTGTQATTSPNHETVQSWLKELEGSSVAETQVAGVLHSVVKRAQNLLTPATIVAELQGDHPHRAELP